MHVHAISNGIGNDNHDEDLGKTLLVPPYYKMVKLK